MSAIGYASLPIVPSLRGLKATLDKEFMGPVTKTSKAAGEALSKNLSDGVERASRDVEAALNREKKATDVVAKAKKKVNELSDEAERKARAVESAENKLSAAQIKAAEQVAKARADLIKLQESGTASAQELAAAQSRVDQVEKSTKAALIDKENALGNARASAAKAADRKSDAEKVLASAEDQAAEASERVLAATTRLDKAQDSASKTTSKLGHAYEQFKAKTSSVASAVGEMAQKYQLHATAVLGGIGMLTKGAIEYAAEAEQSYGAVESIFGSHAQGVIEASKSAAVAVGLSGREYRELSASTGAMLKNMGVPMGEVTSRSQELVGVASDLAATFGGSTKEAVEAVGALMRGEADPIERYGVSIKDADIKARLAADGLDKLEGSAGKQARTQVMLKMLMEQTSSAQGQFARETDTAAHKQQVATAKYNDAKEAIGTGLLPMYAELADKAAGIAQVIGAHPKVFLALGGALAGLAGGVVVVAQVSTAVTALSAALAPLGLTIGGVVSLAAPWVAGIAAAGVALWAFFTKTESGRKMWADLVDGLKDGWQWIKGVFLQGWQASIEVFDKVRAAFGELTAMFTGGDLADGWQNLADIFGEKRAQAIFDFAVQVRETFLLIKAGWEELTTAFAGGDFGYGAFSALFGDEWGERLVDFFAVAGEKVRQFWDSLTSVDLSGIWQSFTAAMQPITDLLTGAFAGTWQSLKDSLWAIGDVVVSLAKSLGGAFFGILQGVLGLLKGLWDVIGPLLMPALKVLGVIVGAVLIGAVVALAKALEGLAWGFARVLEGISWVVDKLGGPLIGAIGQAAHWLGDVLGGALSWIKDALVASFGWIVDTWDKLSTGIAYAWENWIKPAWDAMVLGAQYLIAIIGTAVLAPLLLQWNNFSTAFKWAWETLIKPAWDAMAAAGIWLWQNILVPAFDGIKFVWQGLVDAVKWGWESLLKPAWDALSTAAIWMWTAVLVPAFDGIKLGWSLLVDGIRLAWETILKPAWDAVAVAATWLWQNVLVPAFDGIKLAWNALGDSIRWVVDNVVSPAWDAMKNGLSNLQSFFWQVVEGIKTVWSGLKSALAAPINFMINTVYNSGIKRAWDTMAGFLPGISPAPALSGIPEFKVGGGVSGPGTGTSDSILAKLSNGEHVLTALEVARAGGQDVIYRIRDFLRKGMAFTFDGAGGIIGLPNRMDSRTGDLAGAAPGLFLPKFKDGGAVRPMWELQLENGHRAAQARNGNPYTWAHEDCSGYMSMIADAILNGGNGVRRWATGSFPGGQPWVPGLGQGFSVGVHDNPGGPGGGHTSGTLSAVGNFGAVNVESGGAHGYVAYGGPAAGADSAQWDGVQPGRFHLAIGADGAFEPGGPGGGPSPEKMLSSIYSKIEEMASKALDPIKSQLPAVPPLWHRPPGAALDKGIELVPSSAKAIADNLGDKLRTVYSALSSVKDLVTGTAGDAASFVNQQARRALDSVGLYDNGGWLMPDRLAINRSGKPEPIMADWQWKLFKVLPPALVKLVPPLQRWANEGIQKLEDFANVMGQASAKAGKDWALDTAKSELDYFGLGGLVDIGESLYGRFAPAIKEEMELRRSAGVVEENDPVAGLPPAISPTPPPPPPSYPSPSAVGSRGGTVTAAPIQVTINAVDGQFVHVDDLRQLQDKVDGLEIKINSGTGVSAAGLTRGKAL
ncbi:hypothetical protein WG936_08220 [Corynebacterium sp. H127]|uniref:hypothetical protein n=1 Tax=Corynebacterium sp. H127 TaxID=3133418 RepID=UPI0030B3F4F0